MKKFFFVSISGLIGICLSMSLHAQSSETDLDQVELMKQFIGKWTAETGVDSSTIWEVIPLGKAYEVNLEWLAKGETYLTSIGLLTFARKYTLTEWHHLNWPESGVIQSWVGKFVSDKKVIMEAFNVDHTNNSATTEINFITPDKTTWINKWKGGKESYDDAVVNEWIMTRVKE